MPHNPNQLTQETFALQGLRNQRLKEMQRNLYFQQQEDQERMRTPIERRGPITFGTGATPYDVEQLEGDIASDPYTGVAEQKHVAALRGLQEQAGLGGFGSPQEEAAYGRQQEEFKLRAPIEQARVAGQMDIERQREASRGALEVQKARDESLSGRIEDFAGLRNLFGPSVTGVTIPGVGSIRSATPAQQPGAGILNPLQKARAAVAKEGEYSGGVFSQRTPTPAKVALDQQINSILGTHPAPDHIKAAARQILDSPNLSKLPFEQLIPRLRSRDGSPWTEQEMGDLADLLNIVRGQ